MRTSIVAAALAVVLVTGSAVAQKQPQPKSQGEVEKLQALFGAQDPDSRIKAADELLAKYADTEFKSIALYFAAMSYQQKGAFEKMVVYAERALEADPKQYTSMLMLAKGIAQRVRDNDLDKEDRLTTAEKYAKNAMEALKTAPKPNPQLTDEQWEAGRKDYVSEAHEALGLVAMARKKFDEAIAEYKLAVEGGSQPEPVMMVRLAQAYNAAKKYDEALALSEKVMGMSDVNPQVKSVAQAEKVRAATAKAAAK